MGASVLFCSSSLLLLLVLLPNKEEPPRIVRLRRRTGLLSTTAEADVANGVSGAAEDDADGGSPAAADDACWSIDPFTEATNKKQRPSPNEHVVKIRELLVCLVLGIRRCQEYVGQHDEDYEKNQGGDQRWGDGMVADVLIKLFHRRHTIAYRMWLVDGGHGVRWWR